MTRLRIVIPLLAAALLLSWQPAPASARLHWPHHKHASSHAQQSRPNKPSAATRQPAANADAAKNKATPASTGSNDQTAGGATTGGDEAAGANAPVVVTPSTLIDLFSARFGSLDIELKEAAFLDASVRDLHLKSTNMDMTAGTLDSLNIDLVGAGFQDFLLDGMRLVTQGPLKFDPSTLLNNKVLQFREPASAQVRAIISQNSLNQLLNSPAILARLSGSAKKRVPILSTLARQDVNFGFDFLNGHVDLQPDSHLHLKMESRVGIGKAKMPVPISVEAKLDLQNGWVNLTDTHLLTSGQMVPKDMAARIVNRVNSLSKWGSVSDDIQFQFTNLNVVPEDRLELEGTAIIKRLRLTRQQDADNTQH